MGLGGAYRLRGDFKVIIWRANRKGMGPFFMRGVDPSETLYKDFNAIGGWLGWVKWLKN